MIIGNKHSSIELHEKRKKFVLDKLNDEYSRDWILVTKVISHRMHWQPVPVFYMNGELDSWKREMLSELRKSINHEYARLKQAQKVCGDLPRPIQSYRYQIEKAEVAIQEFMINGPYEFWRGNKPESRQN